MKGAVSTRAATARSLHSIRRNRAEVRVGWDAHSLRLAQWLCPPLIPWLLSVALRRGFFGASTP